MSAADWDAFFAQNNEGQLDMDLNHVHEQEIVDLFTGRMSDQEVDKLLLELDTIAAEEGDRRRRLARTLKTISRMGEIGLKIFKVVT